MGPAIPGTVGESLIAWACGGMKHGALRPTTARVTQPMSSYKPEANPYADLESERTTRLSAETRGSLLRAWAASIPAGFSVHGCARRQPTPASSAASNSHKSPEERWLTLKSGRVMATRKCSNRFWPQPIAPPHYLHRRPSTLRAQFRNPVCARTAVNKKSRRRCIT